MEEGGATYANPGAVEIGLIEAGDDLFDEVLGGAEAAALTQQKRRFLIVDPGVHVQDRLKVAVYPVVSRHFSAPRRKCDHAAELLCASVCVWKWH